jgi:penicillin-binding protein 1A
VAKFTSWFKEQTTKLSKSDTEKPELSKGNKAGESSRSLLPERSQNYKEESTDASSPPTKMTKAKQFFSQVRQVSSGIIAKIPVPKKPLYRRPLFWLSLGIGSGVAAYGFGISSIDRTLPDKALLQAIVREQTLTIKAADGTILKQQGEISREQLKLEAIPDNLEKAFIASEDRRFEKHNGIDAQGIMRAVVSNLRSQDTVEGGSTITQQLSRILFLKQEKTFWRKLKEVRMAQKMEQVLTKSQILERYLNLVYLGSGAYGVGDAASVYFSKTVDQLTLSEMATIAGLAPAPSVYSPIKNPEAAKQRRNLVLQRMQEDGIITATQKNEAVAEPLNLKPSQPKRLEVQSPYFTSFIQKELPKYVSPEVLAGGGLTVETTLNPDWQKAAEEAVNKTLRNQGRWENFKQAALVAVDPRTGEIKTMVGGKDFGKNQFNRVTQAQRQPGSTFKGFVYGAAIAAGISPYETFMDSPLIIDGYEPKNFDEGFRGPLTMRDAITRSINIVAVRILLKVGFNPIIKLAKDMGIKSELKPTYSLALGSNEVNLLEITSAYGTFAAVGQHREAHGIRRIFNREGKEIWTADFAANQAIDPDSAAIMTWMLRNVVEQGTGQNAQLGARPVAGKTGTTDEARDLWFIGYIPQLVTGVWLGNDDNKPTDGSSGSAAYTWHEFMKKAVEGMEIEKFPQKPKLDGRKGTIKAEPIKPNRIVNRPAPSKKDKDGKDDSSDENSSSSRRRSRRVSSDEDSKNTNSEDRPSRRRRRSSQQDSQQSDNNDTPRRSSRRSRQREEDTSDTPRRVRRVSRNEDSGSSRDSSSQSTSSRRRSISTDSASSESPSGSQRSPSESSSGSRRSSGSSSNSSGSSESSSGSSWRERLRPGSSSSE